MKIPVIYEDKDCLVINKPVGLVVNRAESISGQTVQDWVEEQSWFDKEERNKVYRQRSGVCHRLDKETSGCLLIAKTPEALTYFLNMFKERNLKKTYLALVHGRVEPSHGEVVLPLKRSLFDREKWQVHYEGKKAITEWFVEKRFVFPGHEHWGDALTLLRVNLKTGRTHQIRVHLSFLGWPIFADDKYLNSKFSKDDRQHLSHHFLHAASLEFETYGKVKQKVEAELPEDASEFLKLLRSE